MGRAALGLARPHAAAVIASEVLAAAGVRSIVAGEHAGELEACRRRSGSAQPWSGRRLHFVGVGGAGMSGLALISHKLGASVTGSDQSSSCITCGAAHGRWASNQRGGHAAENSSGYGASRSCIRAPSARRTPSAQAHADSAPPLAVARGDRRASKRCIAASGAPRRKTSDDRDDRARTRRHGLDLSTRLAIVALDRTQRGLGRWRVDRRDPARRMDRSLLGPAGRSPASGWTITRPGLVWTSRRPLQVSRRARSRCPVRPRGGRRGAGGGSLRRGEPPRKTTARCPL